MSSSSRSRSNVSLPLLTAAPSLYPNTLALFHSEPLSLFLWFLLHLPPDILLTTHRVTRARRVSISAERSFYVKH